MSAAELANIADAMVALLASLHRIEMLLCVILGAIIGIAIAMWASK